MGRRHRQTGRDVSGILLLDKPIGISSNDALQQVKRLYNARKAGHTGSLDMAASGLLPICLGQATRLSGFLLDADKHYQAVCRLGLTTSTGDAEGEVLETAAVPELTGEQVREALGRFTGTIEQVPPMHSAIKHKGQPLYKLAYQGIEVERKPREVTIHALELLGMGDETLELEIRCSKGTYIRTLAEDIGKELGCGGHVQSLRRLGAGPFTLADAFTLEELKAKAAEPGSLDALLLPMDDALQHWPEVRLAKESAYYMSMGQAVQVPHAPTSGWVRLYNADDARFMGVGRVLADGRIAPKRLLQA